MPRVRGGDDAVLETEMGRSPSIAFAEVQTVVVAFRKEGGHVGTVKNGILRDARKKSTGSGVKRREWGTIVV